MGWAGTWTAIKNYDLSKPALLAPILGADGLGPTRKQWKNFSPVLGLAWAPTEDNKTVVRAGAGIFYDFLFGDGPDFERALLGPPGLSRQNFTGTSILNTLPGIPGVPLDTPLDFPGRPTMFTGADLLSILPAIRVSLLQSLSNADPSVQALQITKQAPAQGLTPRSSPLASAQHVNLGLQREIARDFVLSADFAYRHFIHAGPVAGVDLNHFKSVRGPVIPKCETPAQGNDPQALCSNGPITVSEYVARATYKGLLLRADKRFSHRFQLLGSWAYSSNTGTANFGNGFNLDDWLANRGPLSTDFTHIVNLSGVVQLPRQFQLGMNFSYSSAPPFSAFVGNIGLDLKEDFAEYHVSHQLKRGVLHSERQLIVKLREVPVSEYEAYKKFRKAVLDNYGTYIALAPTNSPALSYQNAIWSLPESTNADATAAFRKAGEEFQSHGLQSGIASLKRAVELDPKFTRAWLSLGELYEHTGQTDEAVGSYRRALEANPKEPILYEALGSTLVGRQKFEDAIAVWQEFVKLDPNNSDAYAALGTSLYRLKRYKESAAAFQSALDLTPEVPGLQVQLGAAYLRALDEDKAMKAYRDALALDDSPGMLNNVSYELADANKDLPRALEYAEKGVLLEEQNSQGAEPSDLKMEDLGHANKLAAYWDTLGWVHFRMRNFEQAEKYLTSAWTLSQSGSIAEHLAEVYEQENKKQSAIHMYKVSLYCYNSMLPRDDAAVVTTQERLDKLTPGRSNSERYNFTEISEDVNLTRTVKLGRSVADEASAHFFIIFARDPETGETKVQGVKFVTGSEELKSADKALMSLKFNFTFPDDGPTRLVRSGILACYKNMGCSFTLIRPSDVHSLN